MSPAFLTPTRLALSAAAALATLTCVSAADFRVTTHYPVGGEGFYDYIRFDPAGNRLFIGHDKRFEVIDADTGKKLGEIGPAARAHGVALAQEFGRGFATCGDFKSPHANSVIMFDLGTLKTISVIKVTGKNPDSIEYDPETKRVYAVNGGSGDVDVIDPATGTIVGTVSLVEGKLEQIGFDGRGHAFVNNEEKSSVHAFDTHTLKAIGTWPLAPGEGGTGLAVDRDHHRLFSACGNEKLLVLNSDTGAVVATPAIGEDPDGAAYDPATGLVFTSSVAGTLSILHQDSPDSYSTVQTLATAYGARTIAYDEKTGRAFLVTAKFGPAPAPTPAVPEPRRPVLPGTLEVLVVGR